MSYVPDFKGSNLHPRAGKAAAKKSTVFDRALSNVGQLGLCAGSLCARYILSNEDVTRYAFAMHARIFQKSARGFRLNVAIEGGLYIKVHKRIRGIIQRRMKN